MYAFNTYLLSIYCVPLIEDLEVTVLGVASYPSWLERGTDNTKFDGLIPAWATHKLHPP